MTPALRGRLLAFAALAAIGAAWGLTMPLSRVAVSTGHAPLTLLFWQRAIGVALLAGPVLIAGRGFEVTWARLRLFFWVGLLGSVLPGYFSYLTAAHLSAGVRSIIVASVPMFALPLALCLGLERPEARRAIGVALGGLSIALIAAAGSDGLAGGAALAMVALALVSPLSYAVEGNYLAVVGARGLNPVEILFGASLVSVAILAPAAIASGAGVGLGSDWGAPEMALAGIGVIDVFAYSGYVWLVGRAGPVFASQIAYVVTGFGLIWSMTLLSERYSPWVWLALAAMLAGVALVQPRRGAANTA